MDFSVTNHGTIFLLEPHSDAAIDWVAEHLPAEALTFGDAVVIEHRFVSDIITGIVADGLEVA